MTLHQLIVLVYSIDMRMLGSGVMKGGCGTFHHFQKRKNGDAIQQRVKEGTFADTASCHTALKPYAVNSD